MAIGHEGNEGNGTVVEQKIVYKPTCNFSSFSFIMVLRSVGESEGSNITFQFPISDFLPTVFQVFDNNDWFALLTFALLSKTQRKTKGGLILLRIANKKKK